MFLKSECLLKVISSPLETIQETYNALMENPNQADLDKIINIIVHKKADHEGKSKKLWNFK